MALLLISGSALIVVPARVCGGKTDLHPHIDRIAIAGRVEEGILVTAYDFHAFLARGCGWRHKAWGGALAEPQGHGVNIHQARDAGGSHRPDPNDDETAKIKELSPASRARMMNPDHAWGSTALHPRLYSDAHYRGLRRDNGQADEKDIRRLDPGRPVKRELIGAGRHTYQISLSAGQFLKVIVEQQGIDVVARVSGPDGGQILEFDSDIRPQGREQATLVAEVAGDYLLIIQSKQPGSVTGSYEIRIDELRAATENDRALQEAHKLYREFLKLYGAGKYDEAAAASGRALEIRERILGPDHPDVAAALNARANVYWFKGDYVRAEPLYQRILSVLERTLEPENPRIAITLNNLAGLYCDKGDYLKAEPFAQRALAIMERALGREHLNVAMSVNTLAIIYSSRGDYVRAEPLFLRSMEVWEKALGPEHPHVGLALSNLATVYQDEGEYARAEPLYQRALAIREKTLGREHSEVAATLNNLATLYLNEGEYEKAEPLYRRALAIREKALSPEHPKVAILLVNLADLYRNKGEYATAEPLYQRALAIFERALGQQHPSLAGALDGLAVLYAAKGDIAHAIEMQSRANAIAEYNLTLNLGGGSERRKLAYLAFSEKQTDFTFLLHSQIAPDDPRALELAFTTLLHQKGRALDSITDTITTLRRHATPQDQKLFDQLIEARSQLAALILKESDAANLDSYRIQLGQMEEKIENLEAELSARSADFRADAQPVTLSAVQSALPAGAALIEFALYTPQDPRTGKRQSPRYLVYLLGAQDQPKWPKFLDLGEASAIDRSVDAWRQSLGENSPDVNRLGRAVDELVMRPIRSLLRSESSEIRRLLIAPDGSLNLIPFAAMVDEANRYLIERYTISYLTSGRDLLRLQTTRPSRNTPLVIADPLFGRASKGVARGAHKADGQGGGEPDPPKLFFRPLPGTKSEALEIKAIMPDASVLLRQEATEAALKRAIAPRILHIATHGFFIGAQDEQGAEALSVSGNDPMRVSDLRLNRWAARIRNPLLRSGLALAGANSGQSGDDDGILTALEVAGLDLWGSKLVALSACNTGLGEIRNGEGVQGLRRALVLAGSESQVISLWAVMDERAKDIMIPYYRALRRGEGRGEGLRQVQLRMLRSRDRRHPFYWAAFIQSGEWANLNGRR
jgi:CHAT domain-containing protein